MKRILAVVVACLAMSAWGQSESKTSGSVLASSGGRFVFGQTSEYRRDHYMLDTQTGRLWQIVQGKFKKADGTEETFNSLEAVPYERDSTFSLPPPAGGK